MFLNDFIPAIKNLHSYYDDEEITITVTLETDGYKLVKEDLELQIKEVKRVNTRQEADALMDSLIQSQ